MTRTDHDDRPAPMMDLLTHHSVRPVPRASIAATATVARLPNPRALAVLDQMFAYHDQDEPRETVDLSYDDVAA